MSGGNNEEGKTTGTATEESSRAASGSKPAEGSPSKVYPTLGPGGRVVPSPKDRRRAVIELVVIFALTAVYLTVLGPGRSTGIDVGAALVGLGLLLIGWERSKRLWGPPASPAFDRLPRCLFLMTFVTVPALLLFAGIAVASETGWRRLVQPNFFIALALYLPWALLQQTLFQFYLQGRLRVILPYAPFWLVAVFNGILYGAVHLPDQPLALVTMAGGVVWSLSYHRDRYLLPIAVSHALLGATFFYWARGADPVARHFSALFGW